MCCVVFAHQHENAILLVVPRIATHLSCVEPHQVVMDYPPSILCYDTRFEFIVQSTSMKLGHPIPILRIFDEAKAEEFYLDFLGFKLDWEHRFEGASAALHADHEG